MLLVSPFVGENTDSKLTQSKDTVVYTKNYMLTPSEDSILSNDDWEFPGQLGIGYSDSYKINGDTISYELKGRVSEPGKYAYVLIGKTPDSKENEFDFFFDPKGFKVDSTFNLTGVVDNPVVIKDFKKYQKNAFPIFYKFED